MVGMKKVMGTNHEIMIWIRLIVEGLAMDADDMNPLFVVYMI